MVTTGWNRNGYQTDSDMLDLSVRGNSKCYNWADFPKNVEAAVGGLIGDTILICGGGTQDDSYDECYNLNQQTATFVTNMTAKRKCAASIVVNQKTLWVTGGWSSDLDVPLASTEYITIKGSTPGPELPVAISAHALVAISNDLSMLIGGEIHEETIASTYYYDHKEHIWISGPNMNSARRWHTAGIVTDEGTKEKLIVASGGDIYGIKLDTTEIFYDNKWNLGNVLSHLNKTQNIKALIH